MVGIALWAVTTQALALPPPPYVVVDIGRSAIGLDTTEFEDEGLQSTGSDRRDGGYAITLGWRFSPYLAAEAAFVELGEGKYTVEDGGAVSNATVGVQSTGVLLALAWTWPIHDKLSLEGRAGAYLGKAETRLRGVVTGPLGSQPFSNLLDSDSTAGLAAGVGAVFAINDTWALRVGYDYLDKAFGQDARRASVGVRFNWP